MSRLRTLTEIQTYQRDGCRHRDHAEYYKAHVVSCQIPCVNVGKKYLIDLDILFEFLKGMQPEDVLLGYINPLRKV